MKIRRIPVFCGIFLFYKKVFLCRGKKILYNGDVLLYNR